MSDMGDIDYGALAAQQDSGPPLDIGGTQAQYEAAGMQMPPSQPDDTLPGACPECGMPMEGNTCPHCGYSHETPVPPENLAEPSMSAKCGIELGKVIMHVATQAVATPVTDPEALKGLAAAAKDFASALKDVSPPPSVPDPTALESAAQQADDQETQRAHDAAEAEAQHEREQEAAEADHERQIEQTQVQAGLQAEQQAAQPQTGGGS